MADGPNLFARLHKWAARQDENFLTESLAIVLEHLLELAPEVGVRLVRQITNGFIEATAADASPVEIRTQIETTSRRPDLELAIPHRLAWVEVKAESDLRIGQLEGYRVLLHESGVEHTLLVLLTRYPAVFAPEDARPDFEVRWYELANWLENELPAADAASELAGFLARQFLDFLRGRNGKKHDACSSRPCHARRRSRAGEPAQHACGGGLGVQGLRQEVYWVGLPWSNGRREVLGRGLFVRAGEALVCHALQDRARSRCQASRRGVGTRELGTRSLSLEAEC